MATVKLQDGKVILKDGKVSCECCGGICNLNLNSAGGSEGYFQSFPVNTEDVGFEITTSFTTYINPDRLIISVVGGSVLYDSGCISTGGLPSNPGAPRVATFLIPPNTQDISVRVIPNCTGLSGTLWVLSIACGGSSGNGIGLSLL